MIDAALLAARLGARFGLDLSAGPGEGPGGLSVRVVGLAPPNGFCVVITPGWRSMGAAFAPDSFASGLMRVLCAEDAQRRKEFSSLATAFASLGASFSFRVDESPADPFALPGGQWSKVELSCTRLTDKSDEQRDAEEVAGACLALVLALLPVDSDAVEVSPLGQGLPEGSLVHVAINRYERSPANRATAIAAHGAYCHACGFDFARIYGPLGEGFIEVHHRTPVSHMGPGYVVSPEKDLVPLCSNCHQMVHRQDPPIPVEDLREILTGRGFVHPKA